MNGINNKGILEKAFHRFNKNQVIEYITGKKVGWVLDKKKKNKEDLKNDFLQLEGSLSKQDIKDLAEMNVMKKKRGLSAYTYKFKHLGKLKDKTVEELQKEFIKSFPLNSVYEIVLAGINIEGENIIVSLKVKEYGNYWKSGVQDLGSLTAFYDNKVIIEKNTKKVSIEAGDDNLEDVIADFLDKRLGLPLSPYTMGIFNASYSNNDSATQKTMLIFDFIYNRLPARGISSSFNKVNFKIKSNHQNGGVQGVSVHGDNIINSDEACKYITLGNDIVSFKTTSIYNGSKVNIEFSLKGKDFDRLKIVITDNKSEQIKQEVMEHIQEEYILMCTHGIKEIEKTRTKLEPIIQAFINSRT
ncbi:hypothetical protein AWH48_14735 [Domibacillus aminovorans]|uniref:Uncharacterized protein n=1 Tax=Domibacillus aminovorans TaxID=29332 RepID=A0A177L1W9_9BACI|nr:hypothetical protein [Domibacillus aminovorans]OAH59394.1 hypothetical protein AWH48_14735 [Domibacillus aminovorans]